MHGRTVFTTSMALLLLVGSPGAAGAQRAESAGVVTTLNGDATITRAAVKPVSLRLRDEVFRRDQIRTEQRSLVRVLLGGKALITVRELSVLTVTEEAGRVTVDLGSGKIGVAVVKARMGPGEMIEIRSPNAVAGVRGTVFVVEVDPTQASSASAPSPTTRVHLLHGALDVSARHDPTQAGVRLAELQSVAVSGNTVGPVKPLSREAVAALTNDLKPPPVADQDAPAEFTGRLIAREQGRAVGLATGLLGLAPTTSAGNQGTLSGTVANVTDQTTATLEQLIDRLAVGTGGAVKGLGAVVGTTCGVRAGPAPYTGDPEGHGRLRHLRRASAELPGPPADPRGNAACW